MSPRFRRFQAGPGLHGIDRAETENITHKGRHYIRQKIGGCEGNIFAAAEEEMTCRVRQLRHKLHCLSAELGAHGVECRCDGSHCILCPTTANHLCTSPASLVCRSLSKALISGG